MNFFKYMRAHYFKTIFLHFLPHKQVKWNKTIILLVKNYLQEILIM